MKELNPDFLQELEDEAREWIAELKSYRAYQGSDRRYAEKAKTAIGVIGHVSRFRATEANRMALELAAERMAGLPAPDRMLSLPERVKRR